MSSDSFFDNNVAVMAERMAGTSGLSTPSLAIQPVAAIPPAPMTSGLMTSLSIIAAAGVERAARRAVRPALAAPRRLTRLWAGREGSRWPRRAAWDP